MAGNPDGAKNPGMFVRPPPYQPQQAGIWLAPYVAIGVFALAMLIVTAVLQWREQDTALSALEGDMHWAERAIEARLRMHQEFLAELGRDQEFRQLNYESFQVRAGRYVRDNPELGAMIAAWKAGDAARLARLMNADESDPRLAEVLLIGRNRNWAQWISKRLETPGTVFVAVGAGHLAGKGSVQDQLKKMGITASRVQ